jgi:integrase
MSDGERVKPKTKAGVRWIELHPFLRSRLEEVLATHSHEYVFVSQTGQPYWHRQSFADEFLRLKQKAGVPDLRWYALRKLFASIRFACDGAVPSDIARELGHTKVSMSLDVYAEVLPHLGCKFADLKFPVASGLTGADVSGVEHQKFD